MTGAAALVHCTKGFAFRPTSFNTTESNFPRVIPGHSKDTEFISSKGVSERSDHLPPRPINREPKYWD